MNATLTGVKKAELVAKIVARCVQSKTWRSECLKEASYHADKTERAAVEAYVKSVYEAAGAGFSGRW